jgi:hypothetical protein
MIDVQVRMDGEKALMAGLRRVSHRMEPAIRRGLTRSIREAHREGTALLSGPGRKRVRTRSYRGKGPTAARGQFAMLGGAPGSYPVPVIMGHLRRELGHVEPGRTKVAGGLVFRAGKLEAVLFDAAEYADVIAQGKGSSAKYGKRPFLTDAVKQVNTAGNLEHELQKEADGL